MELLTFSEEQLGAYLGQFLWPLFRVMGFLMVAPVIGSQLVPTRIRLIIAVAIAVLIAPVLPDMPQVKGLSVQAMLLVGQQLLIGLSLGFFLQMVFQTFVLAGQMIAMQMGLGFASMMDPTNGVNVAVVSSFYLMFVTMLFIALDGHLTMLEVLVGSFRSLPISLDFNFASTSLLAIISSISWIFSSAMIIALPALTALLITNVAFGIMTRAAPQLNIFALGFPVSLLLGVFLMWLTLPAVAESAANLFEQAFIRMAQLTNQ
ncbi:MAG: flagellar biosynthetic protein FliR [Pseudohongiellaceae bacterium]|jgi:flagellar biosynthetic protein FliR